MKLLNKLRSQRVLKHISHNVLTKEKQPCNIPVKDEHETMFNTDVPKQRYGNYVTCLN